MMRRRIKVWLDVDEEPNESYMAGDGLSFRPCHRCGLPFGSRLRVDSAFCSDCNTPDLVGVFMPTDYQFLFESEAA